METIEIELTRVFVKIVQQGSFSKAANLLKIPKSTVSKAVSRLEQQTGTKLLVRTTRNQSLTAAGRAFYEASVEAIQFLEDAQKSLYGFDTIVAGQIKLTSPEDMGLRLIAPVIGKLARKHPKLSFELIYSDQVLDLVKDGIDLAVRLGELTPSGLKAWPLGRVIMIPMASREYLDQKEKIRSPKDLSNHDCLTIGAHAIQRSWKLTRGKEKMTTAIDSRLVSNQMTSLIQMAKDGAGIVMAPHYLCRDDLAKGKLIRVLPEWIGPNIPCTLLSPISIASSARLKIVSDEIAATIRKELSLEN